MPLSCLTDCSVTTDLFRAVDEDSVQDQVGPEKWPLTLDILKELQLCWLVVQSVWILDKKTQMIWLKTTTAMKTSGKRELTQEHSPLWEFCVRLWGTGSSRIDPEQDNDSKFTETLTKGGEWGGAKTHLQFGDDLLLGHVNDANVLHSKGRVGDDGQDSCVHLLGYGGSG